MQIVIEIPEKTYHMINAGFYDYGDMNVIIYNGTPLPKGHGRLIDEKDLSLVTVHMIDGMFVCDAPTIIEADTESEDKV